jgi:8-oxo-dGTP diphosphatase
VGTKGLVFFGENKVLLYVRDDSTDFFPFYIELPGGGVENDESPFETFRRELNEELGLDVKPQDVVYARAHPAMKGSSKTGYFLVATLDSDNIKQIKFGTEGLEYRIVNLAELIKDKLLVPAIKQRIQDYLDYVKPNEYE